MTNKTHVTGASSATSAPSTTATAAEPGAAGSGATRGLRWAASRRAGRATTVAAATTSALLLWIVDRWGGIALTVRQGDTVHPIDPAAVVIAALLAGAAAWALLALLERTVRRPARTYRIIASVVLLLSLAGPLTGTDLGTRLALLGMHLTVGAALIIGLPGRRCS
ncbi:DUF6069 family protein [Actinoplanes xinjiangensis]|uniref:Uncharacterized protein n=1 Tax=Actinoplanes xinjiangensis TaxID=512350 RepID=A0A316FFB1_9ACTN|nr:DUF6069 family protein [Actinoplanes xinjiangensis]PWK47079.1 hypothetical protein BC793_108194 [Actinoplanes xinjiangensis]GIF40238.1 hypothetical protein Axi01nite_45490 [Actinoplanes xinjiangensis]